MYARLPSFARGLLVGIAGTAIIAVVAHWVIDSNRRVHEQEYERKLAEMPPPMFHNDEEMRQYFVDSRRYDAIRMKYHEMAPDMKEWSLQTRPLDGFISCVKDSKDLEKALYWAARIGDFPEDYEPERLFYSGIANELPDGDYKRSLENYEASHRSVPGRVYYYAGRHALAARTYANFICELHREIQGKDDEKNQRHVLAVMSLIFMNWYDLREPFSSYGEFLPFLERERNAIDTADSNSLRLFDDAIAICQRMIELESRYGVSEIDTANDSSYSKWSSKAYDMGCRSLWLDRGGFLSDAEEVSATGGGEPAPPPSP